MKISLTFLIERAYGRKIERSFMEIIRAVGAVSGAVWVGHVLFLSDPQRAHQGGHGPINCGGLDLRSYSALAQAQAALRVFGTDAFWHSLLLHAAAPD